jgi:hypothetical protein
MILTSMRIYGSLDLLILMICSIVEAYTFNFQV